MKRGNARKLRKTHEAGIAQLGLYLDMLGVTEGWLALFDIKSGTPRTQRRYRETVEREGWAIHVSERDATVTQRGSAPAFDRD